MTFPRKPEQVERILSMRLDELFNFARSIQVRVLYDTTKLESLDLQLSYLTDYLNNMVDPVVQVAMKEAIAREAYDG